MNNDKIVQLKSYDEKNGTEIGNVLPITNSEAVKVENNQNLKEKLTEITNKIDQTNASLDNIANINSIQSILNNKKICVRSTVSNELKDLSKKMIDGCKIKNTDGIDIFTPDGDAHYKGFWIRDWAYMLNGYSEYFTLEQIEKALVYYINKCDKVNYYVPDHIGTDGTSYWTAGSDNTWGERATLDGAFFLIDSLYSHFLKSNSTNLYNEYKVLLKNLLEKGVPYSENGLVYIDNNKEVCSYGFNDSVRLTGELHFVSVLAYQSYLQMAVLAYHNKNIDDYNYFYKKSLKIKESLRKVFWVSSYDDLNKIEVGMFKSSTGLCSKQLDVWGSALSVWLNIPTVNQQIAISNNLIINYKKWLNTGTTSIFFNGGIRHVPAETDQIPGSKCWESYITGSDVGYGYYQSGGYWCTPLPWVCYTMSLVDNNLADLLYNEALHYHINIRTSGANAPYEWISVDGTKGVSKYVSTATLSLLVGEHYKNNIKKPMFDGYNQCFSNEVNIDYNVEGSSYINLYNTKICKISGNQDVKNRLVPVEHDGKTRNFNRLILGAKTTDDLLKLETFIPHGVYEYCSNEYVIISFTAKSTVDRTPIGINLFESSNIDGKQIFLTNEYKRYRLIISTNSVKLASLNQDSYMKINFWVNWKVENQKWYGLSNNVSENVSIDIGEIEVQSEYIFDFNYKEFNRYDEIENLKYLYIEDNIQTTRYANVKFVLTADNKAFFIANLNKPMRVLPVIKILGNQNELWYLKDSCNGTIGPVTMNNGNVMSNFTPTFSLDGQQFDGTKIYSILLLNGSKFIVDARY